MKLRTVFSCSILALAVATASPSVRAEEAKADAKADANAPAASPSGAQASDPSILRPAGTSGRDNYLLGAVALGPYVGLSFPHAMRFGLEARTLSGYLGVAAEFGFMPALTITSTSFGLNALNARAMLFPSAGGFFLGAALGRQSAGGSYVDTSTPVAITFNATVASLYVTPMLGWRLESKSGLFFGFELGWQFVLSTATTVTTNPTNTVVESSPQATIARNLVNTFAQYGLPHVSVLQIGFRL